MSTVPNRASFALIVGIFLVAGTAVAQPPALRGQTELKATEQKGARIIVSRTNKYKMEFVYVPAGTFRMGGTYLSGPAYGLYAALAHGSMHASDEGPHRETTISLGFYVLDTKITADWYAVFLNDVKKPDECLHYDFLQKRSIVRKDREYLPAANCSQAMVDSATFTGATEFCKWLSDQTGRRVRLPTEAEWEYVAKGKENRRFPWGDKEPGIETYGFSLNEVRRFPYLAKEFPKNATPTGIYDMGAGFRNGVRTGMPIDTTNRRRWIRKARKKAPTKLSAVSWEKQLVGNIEFRTVIRGLVFEL